MPKKSMERYTLTKEERADLLTKFNLSKPITTYAIRKVATAEGVAAKVIHDTLTRKGATIVTREGRTPPGAKSAPRGWEEAEALFKASSDDSAQAPSSPEDPWEVAAREAKRREAERMDVSLEILAEMEAELVAAKEEAARQTQIAKDAMAQTTELRRATRAEREEMEALRGEIGVLMRQRDSMRKRLEERRESARVVHEEVKFTGKVVRRLIKYVGVLEAERDELRKRLSGSSE